MQHRHMWEHFVFITGEEEEDGLRAIKDTLKEWKMWVRRSWYFTKTKANTMYMNVLI